MDTTGQRALVVEDEPAIRELIALHLKLEGYGVVPSGDGTEALRLARAEPFDLIVLDIMLPGLDGISVLGAIRRDSANRETPILMLTARREEADKVLGLETGADDYLTKPFGVREFVARVHALQRRRQRAEPSAHAAPVTAGPLTVDPARRQARLDGDLLQHGRVRPASDRTCSLPPRFNRKNRHNTATNCRFGFVQHAVTDGVLRRPCRAERPALSKAEHAVRKPLPINWSAFQFVEIQSAP